jgi:hypothetical protein
MTTQKQLEANRKNALKSTGPKTLIGKHRSRWNSLSHGATAASLCIPGEDWRDLKAHHRSLVQYYNPFGPEEKYLVENIALLEWQIRRIDREDAGIIKTELREERLKTIGDTIYNLLCTIEMILTSDFDNKEPGPASPENQADKKILPRLWDAFFDLESDLRSQEALMSKAIIRCTPTLALLERYRMSKERSLYRHRAELRRLQEEREAKKTIDLEGCEKT